MPGRARLPDTLACHAVLLNAVGCLRASLCGSCPNSAKRVGGGVAQYNVKACRCLPPTVYKRWVTVFPARTPSPARPSLYSYGRVADDTAEGIGHGERLIARGD
jgi:hypothetical protein